MENKNGIRNGYGLHDRPFVTKSDPRDGILKHWCDTIKM
jgi:hypothetical protein